MTFSTAGARAVFVFGKIHHRNYFQHRLIFTHLLQKLSEQTHTKPDFKNECAAAQDRSTVSSSQNFGLHHQHDSRWNTECVLCVQEEEEGKKGENNTPAHVEDYKRWWALSEADVCEE